MTTILVIEDNEQNMYLTTFLLEQKGYHVLQAMDGPMGIDLAGRHQPSLILLDIQLPGLDGFGVARQLRAMPEVGLIPIVAVTSYAMVGDKDKAMAAGFTGYLEKPIDPDTFVSQVEYYLPQAGGKPCPPS